MKEQFFFGGTSRPVMIALSHDFTLFNGVFGDCTGLSLMSDEYDRFGGLNLRTPEELHKLADWLRKLEVPSLADKEFDQVSAAFPGFSPQYEDESVSADSDFEGYDATELRLSAVWCRRDHDRGLCLHLNATEPDGVDVQGVPVHLIPALCDALDTFALEWDTNGIDLTRDQPLAKYIAP